MEPETLSYQHPHQAEITFTIKVSKVFSDGSIDPLEVSEKTLNKYGIAKKGVFFVTGFDKVDCIVKTKEVLEKIRYEW